MDSRFFRRRSIAIHFRVFDAASGDFLGRIGDISQGGLLLYGPHRLTVKKTYQLRIEIPEQEGEAPTVLLEAKATWSGVDVNPEFFSSGLRFIALDKPCNQAAVKALLARYTFGADDEDEDEHA